jgi:tellurite resistance protein TerC
MVVFLWIGFIAFVLFMLALDLGAFHKGPRVISAREALRWTGVCVVLALLFNLLLWWMYSEQLFGLGTDPNYPLTGKEAALQFFTGWLIEQSLSLDNVFVIALIFSYFKIPLQFQHRVLFWGILGALIMRGIMITLGVALIRHVSWIHYVFGALLIYAAVKIMLSKEDDLNPEHNILFRLAKRFYPVTPTLHGERFFTELDGRRAMTPLFLVLLIIESTDVLFAVDSIPAVFAITQDPFIVFTSNIFAILNLRSLYFALAAFMDRVRYLKASLVAVLFFVGMKMTLTGHLHISPELSLVVIGGLLGLGVLASVVAERRGRNATP